MDPVRLARIRARVLAAAATVVIPACGGVPEHVNEPRKDREVTPINERQPDGPGKPSDDPNVGNPADKPAEPKHINTPAPDSSTTALDAPPTKPVSVNDIPPPGQTINTVPAGPPTPDHVNTPPPLPTPAPKPPKHINTPEPPR